MLRFAHVHNDMRHIRQLVLVANNAANKLSGIEYAIARHQHLFAIRLWCGALAEASDVVRSGWNGSGLAARLHTRIADDAKNALREFLGYFDKVNPIRTLRREFAFHYDPQPIARENALSANRSFEFVTGLRSGNIFYDSAEQMRVDAMFKAVDAQNPQAGATKLFRDLPRVHDWFMTFSHGVLLAIIDKCGGESKAITSDFVRDPTDVEPILFVDEEAMRRSLVGRGVLTPDDQDSPANTGQ